jgi:hypothetical protein
MTRGKHATSAEARRAREDAIKTSGLALRDLKRANARIGELESELHKAHLDVAANTSSKVLEYEAKIEQLSTSRKSDKHAIKEASSAIERAYMALARERMKTGATVDKACDYVDSVFGGFLVDGEWLEAGLVVLSVTKDMKRLKFKKAPPSVQNNRSNGMKRIIEGASEKEAVATIRQMNLGYDV